MLKKTYYISCILIVVSLIAGCSTYSNKLSISGEINELEWDASIYHTLNSFDSVKMTVINDSISNTGLTLYFENSSNYNCIFGEHYWLEKKINGNWYRVPVMIEGNYGFNDIGYNLSSGSDANWTVDWKWLYGSLDSGEYRIIKDILNFRSAGDFDTYYLAAEFLIK
ncbi:immunoglobulin-like domain-containing protein [Alkaliphilus transvaalensis]|uniref:immunoglobulin-like domain-containing protein n=1 Tax=Alkaliphilus transvaalensis TaxID=114628 RepID=UPI00047DDBD8|nr:immunoglobulin-like domain-containing protein [Alkaliphilus transvaalensis]